MQFYNLPPEKYNGVFFQFTQFNSCFWTSAFFCLLAAVLLKHHKGNQFDPLCLFCFFFPRQGQLYSERYLSWAHTAHCSSSNSLCAVLRIPCFLLPSDSSSLAGPQSSVCSTHSIKWYCEEAAKAVHPHMNGRVGEFPLRLARLLWAPVCSQAPFVLCKQQLCSADWSDMTVVYFFCSRIFVYKCQQTQNERNKNLGL